MSNESLLALVAILTACAPFAASILQYTKESRQASKDAAQLVLKNLRDDYERINKELDESQTECAKWEVIARERQSVVIQKDDEISHLKYELRHSSRKPRKGKRKCKRFCRPVDSGRSS